MAYLKPTVPTLTPAPLPRGRLLDLIPTISGDVRWMDGVSWAPWPSRNVLASSVDTCNPAPSTDIDRYGCTPYVDQQSFRLYDALTGGAIEFTPGELKGLLSDRFALITSYAFAKELLSGAASGGNSLSQAAHAPTGLAFGSGAVPVVDALAFLEAELARTLFGGQGIIHVSPAVMFHAREHLERDGDRWTTPSGHLVVFDGGYVDAVEPTGQAASSATEEWIYASGPVAYEATNPRFVGGDDDAFELERNLYEVYMDSYGLLQFDADPVTAALVTFGTES